MTKVQFDTTAYEFAHGKHPRGFGDWAFFFEGADKVSDTFWAHGSFTEARKSATAEAKRRGVTTVTVGS